MKSVLFVYVLTYGGSLLALVRPWYGLLAYACFAVLRPDHIWAWGLPQGNYSRTVAIALLIGWVVNGFGNWNFRAARPIAMLLVGYWVWILVSAAFAFNQDVAIEYVVLHSKILLPVLVGMTLIESTQQIRQLVWLLVLCLGFLAFEAHGMYFGGQLLQFREDGMGGMDNNSFCIAMATGAGLAGFLGLSERRLWQKLLAFALAGLMIHVPMFGNSRGGMLGILVVGIVAFIVLPKKPGLLLTYATGILVAIRLAGPAVVERFSTVFAEAEERDASAQSRVDLWADCWDVMQRNPIFGIGPDHWPLVAHEYGWPPGKEAHSLWFNCGAELGFVGLFLLVGFYVTTILVVWRNLCRSATVDPIYRDFGRMTIVALSGFMVSASFVSLDAMELPFYVVTIGVGALKLAAAPQLLNATGESSVSAAQAGFAT